jgi:hypothetical protein
MYSPKKRYQIFLIISVLVLISDAIFVFINYRSSKAALEKSVIRQGAELQAEYESYYDLNPGLYAASSTFRCF